MSAPARICLIDDELAVRDALALGLRDAGFEVATAPGAAAGLDILLREGADAVVTDMNMPGTGGAQFIEEARARWPELPIVAISGAAAVGDRGIESLARERGANAVLIKPFRARALVAVLDDLIAARRRPA